MNNPSPQFQSPRALDIAVSLVMALFALLLWAGLVFSITAMPQRLQAHPGSAWDEVALLGMIGFLAIVTSGIAASGLFGRHSEKAQFYWGRSLVFPVALFLGGMLGATIFEPQSAMGFKWKDAWYLIVFAPFLWRKLKSRRDPSNPPS